MHRFIVLMILALIVALCPVVASATDTAAPIATSEAVGTPITLPEASPVTAPVTSELEDPAQEKSVVAEISMALREWIPEIMSAAAFVASMVLVYLFKKGLLPVVAKYLSAIAENVKASNSEVAEESAAFAALLTDLGKRLSEIESREEGRENRLYRETELLSEAFMDMSDTLTDIFENTALAPDVKARIAAKHDAHAEKIKNLLAEIGKNEK